MDTRDTALAVRVQPASTTAAVMRGGHRAPLVFGDRTSLPTAVVEDGSDLLTAVTATRREASGPVVAAWAQHLRTVAAHAGQVELLVLTVPPGWGPRHHDLLTQAGRGAGFPEVQVVSEAAAVAARSYPDARHDTVVVVCQLDQHASQVSVLRRHQGGWEHLATQPIRHVTGHLLDQALAAHLHLLTPTTPELDAQLARARQLLLTGQPAALITAPRPDPITVRPADLDHAAGPLRQAVAAAVTDTLDAAGVDSDRLHAAVVYGDSVQALTPSRHDDDRLGIPATVAADGHFAAVYGALDHAAAATPQTASSTLTAQAGWWRYAGRLATPMIAAAAGGLLMWQQLDLVIRSMPPEIYRQAADEEKLLVYFDSAIFALAGWAFTLSCLATGRHLAAALLTDRSASRQAGRIYAFSAVVALMVAVLQGLLAQAVLGGNPQSMPPYIGSALAGAAIPAVTAVLIGLGAPWLRNPPSWTERIHFPLTSAMLAVAGVAAVTARFNGLPIPGVPSWVLTILGLCGTALLGVAIALTLVTQPAARLVLATLMGVACMIIIGFGNLHNAVIIYLIAVGLWWTRRLARIVADNLPSGWRLAITAARDSAHSQQTRR